MIGRRLSIFLTCTLALAPAAFAEGGVYGSMADTTAEMLAAPPDVGPPPAAPKVWAGEARPSSP